jgi:hypothetical protein
MLECLRDQRLWVRPCIFWGTFAPTVEEQAIASGLVLEQAQGQSLLKEVEGRPFCRASLMVSKRPPNPSFVETFILLTKHKALDECL